VNCPYIVAYNFLGFLEPIPQSSYQRSLTIPVKFRLANAAGTFIADSEASSLACTCRVKVGLDSASSCVSYDVKNYLFQFDLKTAKNTTPRQRLPAISARFR
jgi:hypothetical protein